MTEVFTTVNMPANIGPNWLGTICCKVDMGTGGNIMPLCVFQKLFPSQLDAYGKYTGLHPTVTWLTAYNGSTIPQLGAHDTTIEWRPSSHDPPKHVHTWWYEAETSEPAILGLPSSLKLGVMQLNCAIQLAHKHYTPDLASRQTIGHGKVKSDLSHLWKPVAQYRQSPLPPLNSSKDFIAAYPNCFEGIGCFPGTYTIHLWCDAQPVIHAPHKCLIAMCPLVYEKLDEFLEQEIIVPVMQPTDWVSSLAYSWKANGKLWVCLDPKDLNAAIHCDHKPYPKPRWDHPWAWK